MVRGTANALAHPWIFTERYLSNQIERATWRTTLIRRVTPDLGVGVEYNSQVGQVHPLVNWRLMPETARRPSLMVGTSSDRIGTPYGTAYYLMGSKTVKVGGQPLGPYVGLLWSTYNDRFLIPFGVNVPLTGGLSSQLQYDGRHTHLMTSYSRGRYTLGLLAVRLKDPGVVVSIGY